MLKNKNQQSGFLLIGLIIVAIIIAILATYYFGESKNQQQPTINAGQKAEEQLKQSNQKLQDYQNQLEQQSQ